MQTITSRHSLVKLPFLKTEHSNDILFLNESELLNEAVTQWLTHNGTNLFNYRINQCVWKNWMSEWFINL